MRTAEPRDQCCVELVRLIAREFAVTIGLDACWIDDADPHLLSVQEICKFQPPVAGCLHAGVHPGLFNAYEWR